MRKLSLGERLAEASLFVRVLILLFATVLVVQAVTFALILAMPTPSPPRVALSVIVDALRTGRSEDARLRTAYGAMPWDNMTDNREQFLSAEVADALQLPTRRVRIILMRESGSTSSKRPGRPTSGRLVGPMSFAGSNGRKLPRAGNQGAEIDELVDSVEAGLQLPDGRWRVVSFESGRIANWQWEVLLWLIGSMAVVAPFAWFFAKRIADPIAAFGAAARRLGSNPTAELMSIAGPPEITAALEAVKDMQRQISRYVEDRTMMVGAIAHDLRTPLMRLSLRLQKAPDDVRLASESDIQEIEEMATAALSFVRDLSVRDGRHRVALRALVETVADEFADRGADVVLEEGADVAANVELNGVKRMVNNVVGNAVTYAGSARLRLIVERDAAIIEVADTGSGIPPAELDRVFEPFYRVEQSRNRHTGGTGLGLASARAVARAHGGDIVLSNRAESGLLARITLPL